MIPETTLHNARIFIVDDEESNVVLLDRMLRNQGYRHIFSITDSRLFFDHVAEVAPDLILLDLMMPYMDGYQILREFQTIHDAENYLPTLVLTAALDPKDTLSLGAKDFLTKPFSATEVALRVKNLLETRFLHLELQKRNHELEEGVQARKRELELAQIEILNRLAFAAEFRDDETGEHARRVGILAARLGHAVGLPHEQVRLLRWAAPLHDLGKIGVPDRLLENQEALPSNDLHILYGHPQIGSQILEGSRFPLLQMADQITLTHHERWDGKGYPYGLHDEQIPMVGRITAIVDTFDTLFYGRRETPARSLSDVVHLMEQGAGTQFDPYLISLFLHMINTGGLSFDESEF